METGPAETGPAETERLLRDLEAGDAEAAERLLPLVYDDLRRLAGKLMASERRQHTLQPTALVHEAWLRLAGQSQSGVQSRQHFLRLAAMAMRRVLVDHARGVGAAKRGHGQRVTLHSEDLAALQAPADVLVVDEALARLATADPELAQIAELRVFGGLEHREIAAVLKLSLRSVERHWRIARAWLIDALQEGSGAA